MGKKKIVEKGSTNKNEALRARIVSKLKNKKKITDGLLHIQSTYNNTRVSLSDFEGNIIFTSSSGSLGFKGVKKGTPFAAAKVGEVIGELATGIKLKNIHILVKGVGAGRESAIRSFINKGFEVLSIKDITSVPHNGPRPKKTRRV